MDFKNSDASRSVLHSQQLIMQSMANVLAFLDIPQPMTMSRDSFVFAALPVLPKSVAMQDAVQPIQLFSMDIASAQLLQIIRLAMETMPKSA